MAERRKLTPFEQEVAKLATRLVSARRPWTLRKARRTFEVLYVRHVVDALGGDKRKAARKLGISYSALKEKVRADYLRRQSGD